MDRDINKNYKLICNIGFGYAGEIKSKLQWAIILTQHNIKSFDPYFFKEIPADNNSTSMYDYCTQVENAQNEEYKSSTNNHSINAIKYLRAAQSELLISFNKNELSEKIYLKIYANIVKALKKLN